MSTAGLRPGFGRGGITHCLPVRIEVDESGRAGVVFVDDGARGARGRTVSEGGVAVLDLSLIHISEPTRPY